MSTLKAEILEMVTDRGGVSFAELSRIEGFKDDSDHPDGALAMMHPRFDNIVLWPNVTPEGIEAIRSLMADNAIHWLPCDPIIYVVDGCMLKLPVVKNAQPYKHPRWLPVTFSAGQLPKKYRRVEK